MIPLIFACFMAQYMRINPHFITKYNRWTDFHNGLYSDVFTTGRTDEISDEISNWCNLQWGKSVDGLGTIWRPFDLFLAQEEETTVFFYQYILIIVASVYL